MVRTEMHYEIRGKREVYWQNDGDTIYVRVLKVLREGKQVSPKSVIRKKALTKKGFLKVRVLGIDTPESHYPGPRKCSCGSKKKGIKVPQQALGKDATEFTNKMVPKDARVILETDEDKGSELFYDKYDRVLAYVWTSKGNWKKDKLLNYELVNKGWATPYQIWPNIHYFKKISQAAIRQRQHPKHVYKALRKNIIPYNKLAGSKTLNEPFLYRKVIDGKFCDKLPKSLLTREVFDVRNQLTYPPHEYYKVPIPFRIFKDPHN